MVTNKISSGTLTLSVITHRDNYINAGTLKVSGLGRQTAVSIASGATYDVDSIRYCRLN